MNELNGNGKIVEKPVCHSVTFSQVFMSKLQKNATKFQVNEIKSVCLHL